MASDELERETRSGGGGAAFANPTDRIGSEEEFVGSDEARPSSSAAPGAGGGVGDGGRRESKLPRERGERERDRGEGIAKLRRRVMSGRTRGEKKYCRKV